jgi:hypothetical protein
MVPPDGRPDPDQTPRGDITLMNATLNAIKVGDVPEGRKATSLRFCSTDDRPQKEHMRRVRFTVGRNRVESPGEVSTKTASIATAFASSNTIILLSNQLPIYKLILFYRHHLDALNQCIWHDD